MKHSSNLTHLKDSQYLWHFLEIHEKPFAEYNDYKSNMDISVEEQVRGFQNKFDIDISPYLFTAHCLDSNTFHRFVLYMKRYIDVKDVKDHGVTNDMFTLHILEQSEAYEIMTILLLFQYFFI